MENKNNINVTIRMNKEKVEKLKIIARDKSCKENIDITYNDLIVAATYKEYFNEREKE